MFAKGEGGGTMAGIGEGDSEHTYRMSTEKCIELLSHCTCKTNVTLYVYYTLT